MVNNDNASKALQCDADKCKVWYHLECTKISEALYDLINENAKDNDDGIRWLCPKCSGNEKVINIVEKPVDTVAVCSKLRHGTCPHGITGKSEHRGKICEFHHPKLCKKFVRNGNGGRFGCKNGNRCDFFHPILCKNSVKFRKCLDHKCTYVHLRGTARKERKTEQFPPTISNYPANRNAIWQPNQWWRNSPKSNAPNREQPFLGPSPTPPIPFKHR